MVGDAALLCSICMGDNMYPLLAHTIQYNTIQYNSIHCELLKASSLVLVSG